MITTIKTSTHNLNMVFQYVIVETSGVPSLPALHGLSRLWLWRFVIRFILSPWCNVFPISLRCDAHSCSPGVASV